MTSQRAIAILGGEGQLGRLMARFFHEAGLRVFSVDREPYANRDERVEFFACNLADASAATQGGQQLSGLTGGIDYCICTVRDRDHHDSEARLLTQAFATSVVGPHLFIDAVRTSGRSTKLVSVVTITSALSRMVSGKADIGYHVAKAAQEALIRWQAVNWGPSGIRVNGIAPGYIDYSDVSIPEPHRIPSPDWANDDVLKSAHVLAEPTDPISICNAVLFLLRADGLTGQSISVDGGSALLEQLGVLLDFQARMQARGTGERVRK